MGQIAEFTATLKMQLEGNGLKDATAQMDIAQKSGSALDSVMNHFVFTLGDVMNLGNKVADSLWTMAQKAADNETYIAKLAGAMKDQGIYSKAALDANIQYADQLQDLTKYDNDLTLQMMQLLTTFGLHDDQLRNVTVAAMNLASEKSIDLRSATQLLGKAFQGHTETLARYGVAIDTSKSKTEQFNEIITRYTKNSNAAKDETATFNGSMAQFKNAVDVLEKAIGKGLLPTLTNMVNGMKEISGEAKNSGVYIKAYGELLEKNNSKMADATGFNAYKRLLQEIAAGSTAAGNAIAGYISTSAKGLIKATEDAAVAHKQYAQQVASDETLIQNADKRSRAEKDMDAKLLQEYKDQHVKYAQQVSDDEGKIQDAVRKTEAAQKKAIEDTIKEIVKYEKQSQETENHRRMEFQQSLDKFNVMVSATTNLTSNLSAYQNQEIQNTLTESTEAENKKYEDKKTYIEQNVTDETEKKKQLDALETDHQATLTSLQDQATRDERQRRQDMKPALIAEAIANTALGVTKAIAEGGIFGIVTGALVAAAGAIQIATIQAQKFAKGGINVGGLSLVGEEGPELVELPQGSNVFSNSQSRAMLAGAGGMSIVIHANGPANREFARQIGNEIMTKINRNIKW